MLSVWIDHALSSIDTIASDLSEAHKWLQRIADCLRYPEHSKGSIDDVTKVTNTAKISLTSLQVRRDMEELLQQFQPDPQQHPAQFALKKSYNVYGINTVLTYYTAIISLVYQQIT